MNLLALNRFASAVILAACAFCAAAQVTEPPTDDPLRHLEDGADPRTSAFFSDQAQAARSALDAIPGRAAMLARIRALSGAATTITSIAVTPTRLFYLKLDPRHASPILCMRDGLAAPERV